MLAGPGPVLVSLLDEAGLRIGEALGLRHEDLSLRRAEVRVVPRDDNANQARVKRMKERAVPVRDVVLDLYADYMELEYGMLDCDYALVTLSGPTRGAPMTRHGAGKLFSRLRQRTGIGHLHAHAYRHTYATRLLPGRGAGPGRRRAARPLKLADHDGDLDQRRRRAGPEVAPPTRPASC